MLDQYAIAENSPEYFASFLECAHLKGEIFRLQFKNGEEVDCIPIVRENTIGFQLKGKFYEIPLHQIIKATFLERHDDSYFMDIAINESRKCSGEDGRVTPKVGAVLAIGGKLIGKARRGQLSPGEHAEYTLLDKILDDRNISGSTLYTTLEPCTTRNHPKVPCAKRIIDRRVERVVIGILDPNWKIKGEGFWRLREAGIEVAVCSAFQMKMIEDLNREFIRLHRN